MKKRFWIIFVISLVGIASYFLHRTNVLSQREYHIFCETLTPGMSSNDVLNSLKAFGDINYSTPLPSAGAYDEIAVGFIDLRIVGQKTYILSFQNGKYLGASVIPSFWEGKGIGSVTAVCDQ